MGYYKDADQLYELLGQLFEDLKADPEIAKKIAASGLVVRFAYSDPDSEIWIDAHEKDPDKAEIILGDPGDGRKADITMSMDADTAHQFWLGDLNLMAALTRRKIVAKGPIPKAMKLLPVIKPAYPMYRELLASKGLQP
ncbi:MAG TPA: SCP2 sterol-binding domain-containing protein [Candidatus Anoxymicrobiaceae bacterium]|jgi:putative sterol carrier protein